MVVGEGWVAIVSRDADPGTMANGALTAGSSVPEAARRVYPVPASFTRRSLKVATPFCASTVSVPLKTAPVGLAARETVTGMSPSVTIPPWLFRTSTRTAGMGKPAAPVAGWF